MGVWTRKAETWNDFSIRPLTEEKVWTLEGVPILEARASLPRPAAGWKRIGRFYQAQSRAFLRYCQEDLRLWAEAEGKRALSNSAPVPCFRSELTFQETYRAGRLWSLYTEVRENATPGVFPSGTGSGLSAPGVSLRRWGDTWDLSTGFPVPLSAFFPPRSHWRKRLLETAAEEIAQQEKRGYARYHPGWRKLLRKYFNARNYYLTREGIVFFYPMYAIAPAVEGIPAFPLPWEGDAPVAPLR